MVIHHFNRIIRNKWIWGVFAVAISVFFAFDFLFTGHDADPRSSGGAGTLGGRDVSSKEFLALADDVRGYGRQRNHELPAAEVNRRVWEELAALEVAESLQLTATDDEVRRAYRAQAKKHHPDLLRAQGLPEEMVARATAQMARINAAWEEIKRARGI